MANKAVFLDRDNTIIEDPGYISDPGAVKLLPGVELAIKSLRQAGYKIVVVTNQAGVARGLLTEEVLEKIHAEMRRQLAEKGVHLDAIYYCPFHPEGTVEGYASDSDLRKPRPGMLTKGAKELEIDLAESWMVGDSPCDVEAGQRAGCKTIRLRTRGGHVSAPEADEDVQADYTLRNLVDAAKVILRETTRPGAVTAAEGKAVRPGRGDEFESMNDRDIRREILRQVRQLARGGETDEFSAAKLVGAIVQVLTLLALLLVFWKMLSDAPPTEAMLWALIAVVGQVMAMTFFSMRRQK